MSMLPIVRANNARVRMADMRPVQGWSFAQRTVQKFQRCALEMRKSLNTCTRATERSSSGYTK
jgi:hypothetical protein